MMQVADLNIGEIYKVSFASNRIDWRTSHFETDQEAVDYWNGETRYPKKIDIIPNGAVILMLALLQADGESIIGKILHNSRVCYVILDFFSKHLELQKVDDHDCS